MDHTAYESPQERSHILTHEDVHLVYFASQHSLFEALLADYTLQVNEDGCKDIAGHKVVRFSLKFQQTIQTQLL